MMNLVEQNIDVHMFNVSDLALVLWLLAPGIGK